MSKLIVSEFVSVDGVMEDPGGSERSRNGGWASRFERGPDGDLLKLQEIVSASALLLGRKTYEGFAAEWPGQKDDEGFAERMNSMPKYVVSRTSIDPRWNNTTVISGNVFEEVRRLKDQAGGHILVNGSCDLVHGLIENRLVDEVRLMVFPIVLGSGRRLFADSPHTWPFRLLSARPVGSDGVLIVTYAPR